MPGGLAVRTRDCDHHGYVGKRLQALMSIGIHRDSVSIRMSTRNKGTTTRSASLAGTPTLRRFISPMLSRLLWRGVTTSLSADRSPKNPYCACLT
jgi:hypothetical protein